MAVRPPRPKPKVRNKGYANPLTAMQRIGLPVDAELLWRGTRAPNPNFKPAGYGNLTPINVGGQWQVYGTKTDPIGAAAQPTIDAINAEKERAQKWATESVAPWAGAVFGNLASLNNQAQAGYQNALGRGLSNLGNAAAAAPTTGAAGTEGLATPTAVGAQAAAAGSAANAQGAIDTGAYGAALRSLGMGATAQSQIAALGSQIANIPRAYDERLTKFMESLVPLRLQLEQSRSERQMARDQWLAEFGEGQRRFDAQTSLEAQLTGMKLEQDQAQFDAELAQDQTEFNTEQAAAAAKATSYTEKEARTAGGRGFWKVKPRKPPKGTSLVQATDTGRWIAIPANKSGSGSSGGSESAAAKRYRDLREDWAANAYEWLNSSTTTSTVDGETRRTTTPPKFKTGMAFFRSALAAGLNVSDAYNILLENGGKQVPSPEEVYDEIAKRNPRLNASQINSRVRAITGKYAKRGNHEMGP